MSKFGNKKTTLYGISFASQLEANCYGKLRERQDRGEITDLRLQVALPCHVNGLLVCTYIADFTYTEAGLLVVADAKGYPTPEYRLKKKLVRAVHGIEIKEMR